jgi:hypothetical protein
MEPIRGSSIGSATSLASDRISRDQQAMSRPVASREKWDEWFETLGGEIYTLRMYRTFWREFIKTAEAAGVTPGHIFDFVAGTYSTRQAVAIRRLCGVGNREYSFHHLFSEIRDNAHLCKNPLDPNEVQTDIESLRAGHLLSVRGFVNQYVAHRQEVPTAEVPTFKVIHDAIDELGMLLQKYVHVVNDAHQILDPAVPGDWMAPFRVAWLPPRPTSPRKPIR